MACSPFNLYRQRATKENMITNTYKIRTTKMVEEYDLTYRSKSGLKHWVILFKDHTNNWYLTYIDSFYGSVKKAALEATYDCGRPIGQWEESTTFATYKKDIKTYLNQHNLSV
jgi:hypothetical protein